MTVRVLFFSSLQDIVGQSEIEESLSEDRSWTVGDLIETIYQKHPRLRDWDASLLLAVNQGWSERSQPLAEGDEIALMPPVQGG